MQRQSELTTMLATWRAEERSDQRVACVDALGRSVLFVCAAADPRVTRTGLEPHFRIAEWQDRRWVVSAAPDGGAESHLFAFSQRAEAEAWSARVPGFGAEPVAGAAAIHLARAHQSSLVIDPTDPMPFVFSAVELGFAPQRAIARAFSAALAVELAGDALLDAIRDTVFYFRAADAGAAMEPGATSLMNVGSLAVLVQAHEGRPLLVAESLLGDVIPQLTEGFWIHPLDGAGLVTLCCELGADLCLDRAVIIDARALEHGPKRVLSLDEF